MGDRLLQPAAPFRALRRSLDEELQNPDVLAFLDATRARRWDAGVSDALDGGPRPVPWQVLKRDATRTVLRQVHLILVGEDVQKSACRAACLQVSGLLPQVPCKWVAAPSAAVSCVWLAQRV